MYIIINVYVHAIYISIYSCTCLYTFMNKRTCINMYRHVCTMFRHVCTVLPIFIQVYRIPDVEMMTTQPQERGRASVRKHGTRSAVQVNSTRHVLGICYSD